MSNQKKSRFGFGLGLLIGSIIGGLTALFFAPKSGKELREDVKKKIKELERLLAEKELDKKAKKMMGELSEEAKVWYEKAKTWLIEELASLKKGIENINWQDYQKAVAKIISRLKKEAKKEGREIEVIRKSLLRGWKKNGKISKN
jgi:gas vesicle protein